MVNRTFSKEVSLKHDQHCSTLFISQLLHNYSHSRLWDYVQQIQFTYTKRKLNNYSSFTSVLKAFKKNKHTQWQQIKIKTQRSQLYSSSTVVHALCICLLYYRHHRHKLSTIKIYIPFPVYHSILLVYKASSMMLRNFVSSKSFSVLSHEKDLKIRREAGISWVIFKSHLLEMCIIQYCKYKEGERLHHTLRGHYQNSEFLWYVFSFFVLHFFPQFLQIHLNWCNIERWVIQVLMLPSMCSQKLLLPQCWPFYKDTVSPDSIYYQRIRCNFFFFSICI